MSDLEPQPQRGEIATEVVSNVVTEFIKALAMLNHIDPMTA